MKATIHLGYNDADSVEVTEQYNHTTTPIHVTLKDGEGELWMFLSIKHARELWHALGVSLRELDSTVEPEPEPIRTVDKYGIIRYELDGQRHRIDGPAVIDGDRQEWWLNGKRHRIDGPAFISGDYQAWWLNGVEMTEAEHAERVAQMAAAEVIA